MKTSSQQLIVYISRSDDPPKTIGLDQWWLVTSHREKRHPRRDSCLVVMSACFYTLRISPVFSKEWKSESEVRDPMSEEMMLVLGHVTIRKHGWRGWKAGLVYVVVHARSCCCCRLPIFCPSMSGSLTTEPHI